ncbi:MAG: integrin alpha [Candidatus Thermoplasmatota archaeon]|nr:integrin alpha [Candidatus Thermoplasmatota archaeon]
MGFATNPDRSYQSISSGTLFGYRVEIINDMNKDGFDELLISEPYNTTTFNSGNLWVFYGNSSGVADQPSARIAGDANDLLGVNFASAGDTNDDGFNDLLITRKAGMQQSQVELILGSNEIIDGSSHFIASGSSDYASVIASQGDSNGDNLPEFVFPATIIDEAQTEHTILQLFSRKLFDVSEVTVTGESVDGKIQSSTSGVPRIILDTVNTSADSGKTQMISLQSDSQSDYWQIQTITAEASPFNGGSNFAITSSGSPYVFYINDGLNLRKYTGYTGIESSIATNSDVEFVSSTAGSNGDMFVAYYSPFSNQLFINVQTESGWSEQLVADSANISSPISLMVDALGSPFIIFRDDVTMELNIATKTAGWTVENLSTSGNLLAESFATAVTQDGQIHIAAILDDGNFNNLSVITVNEQSIDTSFVAIESDLSTKLALVADDNNGLVLSALTSAGSMMVYEKAIDSNNWNPILLPQPQNLSSSSHIDAVGGDIPLIVVNSQVNSVYARTQGKWEVIAENLGDSVDDFTIVKTNKHIIVIFRQANTGLISWRSMEYSEGLNTDEIWHSSPIDGLANQNGFSATYANDIIHLYIKEPSSNQITSVHLHKDSDNDHIFDEIDGLENIPNQWLDQDGDGYGDNKNAPLSDACPTQSGSSSLFNLGCFDADGDGYDDLIDDCNTGYGASWLGRIGCSDFDQDGWVDWNSQYPYGDIFSDNWKQVFDTDGDSYGDNHGPDCCDTWYDSNAPPGDAFPFDPKQYTDYDGDGYGDNSSDFIGGDACKFDYGTSYIDRLGCHDSDGDGASDPTNFWNESSGADIWPDDPTQWADSDGDGFGDNASKNATNPDYFPNNIAATNDTDEDGYPDSFNEFYDGTNAQGLQIDGCPLVAGNSTNPFYGCVDSDGDNYRDIYTYDINPTTGLRENETGDAFPYDPNQWADTDGDGFGNFPGGELADVCPNAVGVVNGTLGIGCPLIDGNDEDGDFVINENDVCPDTQFGLVVDLSGCANNQLDDDNDGITNDADICPETVDVTTVDTTGCSLPQRQIDTDSDGIYDYLDLCKSTPLNEIPDFDGCSLSQKDSDGDGVTDDTDVCPETPENYPVLSDGCTDESAKEIDWDGDGYTLDDQYMFEPTQWADSDGDGYGDNPLGVDGDQCPEVSGTSTRDRLGCIDSDLDGYSNPTAEFPASPSGLADAFLDDITQWRDIDGDGYGDNSSGTNPDLCPSTNPLYKTSVDLNGCAANERDTDNDGIVDSLDNCPSEARGIDGYNDGCPLEKQSDSSSSNMILGMSIITFISLVTGIVILLVVIIVILRNRGLYDEDWFEDDDDFDDEYQEDRLSFLDRERGKRRQQLIQRNNPPRNGPVGAPPLMVSTMSASLQPTNKPVPKPPRFTSKNTQSRTPPVNKKVAKKVKKSSESEKKVKRAVVDIEEDIFENIPKSSIDDAIEEIGDVSARDERQLLMHLQERGWNAPQSRALINLAKTKSR